MSGNNSPPTKTEVQLENYDKKPVTPTPIKSVSNDSVAHINMNVDDGDQSGDEVVSTNNNSEKSTDLK